MRQWLPLLAIPLREEWSQRGRWQVGTSLPGIGYRRQRRARGSLAWWEVGGAQGAERVGTAGGERAGIVRWEWASVGRETEEGPAHRRRPRVER